MSPLGKWLLKNCDNDLKIDLKNFFSPPLMINPDYTRARMVATHLGISIVGGS
jgi:hypothetical protein